MHSRQRSDGLSGSRCKGAVMEFHRFADVFPLMPDAELQALADDIRRNGLREPMITFEAKILDGRNRYRACTLAGVAAQFKPFTGTPLEALKLVWSENYLRRHLTSSQGAVASHKYEILNSEIVEGERTAAKERQRKGASEGGKASGRTRRGETKAVQRIGQPSRTHATDTDAKLAAVTGTNRQYVADVRKIAAVKPQALEEIEAGKKTVPQVRREIQVEQRKQELAAKAKVVEASFPDQPLWTLIHADVFDGLSSVRDHHGPARLIFADPPYNIGIDYGNGAKADRLPDRDYLTWAEQWIGAAKECMTGDGSLWVMICDEYAAEYVLAIKRAGFTVRNWIKWYETFGVNCATQFNRTSRHIIYAVEDPKRYVFNMVDEVTRQSDRQTKYGDKRANPGGKLWDDVWQIPRLTGTCSERIPDFPTQVPLAVMRPIIAVASEPGDLIVDPFSGSASTGVAAVTAKPGPRKYIGIEKQKRFIEAAHNRLALL